MEQMLESTFIEILNMSLTASVIIAAVFLARVLLKKAPGIYTYLLWGIVLFRLLCPISFESDLSLLGVLQNESAVEGRMEYIPQDIGDHLEPEVHLPIEAANEVVNDSLPAGNPQGSVNPLQIWLYLGARIWILGIAAIVVYSAVSLWKLRKLLKDAVWEKDNIYRMSGSHSPFVYGLFGPCIYLPEHLENGELDYVLLHEQIHIKRGDQFYRMLGYVALCIHWFNPLVWFAFSFSGRDMEISCDEAVIRKLGNGVKKEYSASLLNLACGDKIVKGIPAAFGETDTGSRIKHVLKYQKPAKMFGVIATVFCGILAVAFMANPPEEKDADSPDTFTEIAKTTEVIEQDYPIESEDKLDPVNPQNGTYLVNIRSISRSARCIDRYVADTISDDMSELFFSEDCVFEVNTAMSKVNYEEVSFDEFVDYLKDKKDYTNAPCTIIFENGLITKVTLKSAYISYGISYQPFVKKNPVDELMDEVKGEERPEHTAIATSAREELKFDVSDREGEELIAIREGTIVSAQENCGMVEFRGKKGELLYREYALLSRVGWNNLYLGEAEGIKYILRMSIEDRDNTGVYEYQVFRLGGPGNVEWNPVLGTRVSGEILQIAGSSFEWGENYIYDDDLFKEWVNNLEYYLEHSFLILSSQNGELRTEQICELDKYNYETLKRE